MKRLKEIVSTTKAIEEKANGLQFRSQKDARTMTWIIMAVMSLRSQAEALDSERHLWIKKETQTEYEERVYGPRD